MRAKCLESIIVVCTILGCSSRRQPPESAPLTTGTWRALTVNGQTAVPPDVARRPWLQFVADSGRVFGSAGCNRIAGPYTVTGSSLKFGAMAMTRMACLDSALDAQETAFAAALQETDRFTVVADTLTLFSGTTPRLRLGRH